MSARTPETDQRGVPREAGESGVTARHSVVFAATHATAFLAGVWLVLSPYVFDQRVGGLWCDLCAGAVLAVSGAAALVEPGSVKVWRPVQLVAGAWLIAAPFALGQDAVASATRVGDLLLGTVVLVAWAVGAAAVFRAHRRGERRRRRGSWAGRRRV
ncbi:MULTISPECIES: SPW repeat domain-containing protein [unclassified Amycolatopsis]|uniref:SPW repeat domain-containing protein n=1 Tax=unclassified Amycolatopsis TaxID=2618356 RepID=UPI002E1DE2D8|nr:MULTISPECIES: hypothetical protein [unclassified Amycolatopsis]